MALLLSLSNTVVGHTAGSTVLAHQGGWDEMLMVVVPVAVFAGLLYVANKRATKLPGKAEGSDGADAGGPQSAAKRPDPRNDRGGPI